MMRIFACISVLVLLGATLSYADEKQPSRNLPPVAVRQVDAELQKLTAQINQLQAEMAQTRAALRAQEAELTQKLRVLEQQKVLLEKKKAELAKQNQALEYLWHVTTAEATESGKWIIGVSVTPSADGLTIMEPIADMPAAKAGLKEGDQIVAINGLRIRNLQDFQQILQVARDQSVTLTVRRPDQDKPVQVKVTPQQRKEEKKVRIWNVESGKPEVIYSYQLLKNGAELDKAKAIQSIPSPAKIKELEERIRKLEEQLKKQEK